MATIDSNNNIIIRNCTPDDMADVQRIYAHYVENSFASFEEVPPDVGEMKNRFDTIMQKKHPYIVAVLDGKIVGFAYASTFRTRSAYRFTVEDSIYVNPEVIGKGIGSMLIENLIEMCREMGFHQMVAIIGSSENSYSVKLHERFGFKQAGILNEAGYKFDRWVNTVIMQRMLD